MTLPPLPPRDLGTIRLGRVDQDMGYSDEAMRAYAEQAVASERERCARVAEQQAECNGLAAGWHIAAVIREG